MCNGSCRRSPEIPARFPFDVISARDGWFYLRRTDSPAILCSSRDPRVIASHYRDALTRWLDATRRLADNANA